MSLIDAFPMRQISSVPDPASLYADLISMILRLAQYGLIHGDFNEFNILVKEEQNHDRAADTEEERMTLKPILIDFPQMVSIDHVNAEYYFDRDVNCIKRFFERRFNFTSDEIGPKFEEARKLLGKDGVKRLDVSVEASGFSRKMAKELETYMKEVGVDGDGLLGATTADEEFGEGEEDHKVENEEEEQEMVDGHLEDGAGVKDSITPATLTFKDSAVSKDRFGNDVALSRLQLWDAT
jgi:RIO kinase 2